MSTVSSEAPILDADSSGSARGTTALPPPASWRPLLPVLLPFLVSAALLAALGWPMLTWWWWEYTQPESYYRHGPLIPFLAGFMLWTLRDRLRATPLKPFPPALAVLVPALVLYVVSVKTEMRAISSLTFMLVLWSGVWLALGNAFLKAAWFPLAFLALMMPLPGPVLNDATLHLQMASTVLAAKLLSAVGFTNVLDGNYIRLDDFTMFVDVPCSGFKTLLALMTFNAFLSFCLDGPAWKRVLLFAICAPLALVINGVRIALIGVVGECLGSGAAHVFHDYSGLITLTLGFFALFSLAKALGCRKFAEWDIF